MTEIAASFRWAERGSFSAYDECKLWAWTVFGAAILGMRASVETGSLLYFNCYPQDAMKRKYVCRILSDRLSCHFGLIILTSLP